MDANVDINSETHQGTALHEAALFGKIGAVKLLIDVSTPSPSSCLTAVDAFWCPPILSTCVISLEDHSFDSHDALVCCISCSGDSINLL